MAGSRDPAPKTPGDIDPDDGYRDEVDAFLTRNRDELNASIKRSRAEFAQGIHSHLTVDDIIQAGLKRHRDR